MSGGAGPRRTAAEYIRSGGAVDVGAGRAAAGREGGRGDVVVQAMRLDGKGGSTVERVGEWTGNPEAAGTPGQPGVTTEISADMLVPAASLSSGGRYQESKSSTSSLVGTFVRAMTNEGAASRLAQVESDARRSKPKVVREPQLLRSQSRRWLLSSAAQSAGPASARSLTMPAAPGRQPARAADSAVLFPPLRSPKVALTPHTYIHASLDRSLHGSRQSKANAFVRSRYASTRGGGAPARARGDAGPSSSDTESGYWEVPFFNRSRLRAGGLHIDVSPEVSLERSIISSGRVFTWGGRHTYTRNRAGLVSFDPNRDRLIASNANWT